MFLCDFQFYLSLSFSISVRMRFFSVWLFVWVCNARKWRSLLSDVMRQFCHIHTHFTNFQLALFACWRSTKKQFFLLIYRSCFVRVEQSESEILCAMHTNQVYSIGNESCACFCLPVTLFFCTHFFFQIITLVGFCARLLFFKTTIVLPCNKSFTFL